MNSSIIPALVLGGIFAACTPEPARRSAVDSNSICANNPDKPVWNGSCLRTQAAQGGADAAGRGGGDETVEGAGEPAPGAGEPAPGAREPAAGAGEPAAGAGEPAAGAGEPAAGAGGAPAPGAGAPAPGAGAPAPAGGDPAADRAAAIRVITDAIDKHGPGAVEGIGKTLKGGGGTQPSGGPQPAQKTYVVTFTKDSFVGIADSSVVKNCFVSSGSVLEVKGQPQKVSEFSSMGVNQYVTGEVLEANLVGASSESCALKGKDFVYLGGHASVAAKP